MVMQQGFLRCSVCGYSNILMSPPTPPNETEQGGMESIKLPPPPDGFGAGEQMQAPFPMPGDFNTMTDEEYIGWLYGQRESGLIDDDAWAAIKGSVPDSSGGPDVPDKYVAAPFSYDPIHGESVNLNSGDLVYQTVDVSLPGVNGLDLALARRYDSGKSMVYEPGATYNMVSQVVGYTVLVTQTYTEASFGSHGVLEGALYFNNYNDAITFVNSIVGQYPYYYSDIDPACTTRYITMTVSTVIIPDTIQVPDPNNTNQTPSNAYADTGLGLGLGWSFAFSSIEFTNGNNTYLHTAEGGIYQYEFTSTAGDSNLKDYTRGDLRLEPEPGGYNGAAYTLYRSGGAREHFNSSGRLMAIRDRYDNQITFSYGSDGVSSITDSAGRVISFTKVPIDANNYKTVATLPDNTTLTYAFAKVGTYNNVDRYRLASFTDQNGDVTAYSYDLKAIKFSGFNRSVGASSDGANYQSALTAVNYPNGVSAQYTYELATRSFGPTGFEQFYRISMRNDAESAAQYNTKSYSYSTVGYTGYATNNSTDPSNLPSNHTYATTVTDAAGTVTVHTFNNKHLKTLEVVKQGQSTLASTEYEYNAMKLPTRVTGKLYDGANFVESIDLAEYDPKGRLSASWGPAANGNSSNTEHKTVYTYDNNFDLPLTKAYKPNASTTVTEQYTLTSDNKSVASYEVKENGATKQKTAFIYDAKGQATNVRRYKDGFSAYIETVNTYSQQGLLTNTVTAGVSTSATYDAMGRPITATDGKNQSTGFQYDSKGNISKLTHPDGSFVAYARNYALNTLTVTDEMGYAARYEYNGFGLEKRVYDVTGNAELSIKAYDAMLRLSTSRGAPGSATTTYAYDALGRVTSASNALYAETYAYSVTPSGLARTLKTIVGEAGSPSLRTVSYVSNLGLTVSEGAVTGASAEVLCTYAYDYLGRMISKTDPLANTTSWAYNVFGQVTAEANALNGTAAFTYDALGNCTGSTDYNGTLTTYTYDSFGRLLTRESPMDQSQTMLASYTYDNNGNVLTETVAVTSTVNRTASYSYNSRDLLTSVTQNGETVSYTYDLRGLMLTMTDNAGNTTGYVYDRLGRIESVTDALNQTESYAYNAQGWLGVKVDRNNGVTSYAYDALGRMTSESAGPVVTATAYYASGPVKSSANGTLTLNYTYDDRGGLASETESSNGATLSSKAYEYDARGLRTKLAAAMPGQAVTTTYTYDELGRLKTAAEGGKTATYTYDANGNRASLATPGAVTTYTYNLANLVTGMANTANGAVVSSYSYTYYRDGNQASKKDKNNETVTYTYDGSGRLLTETYSDASLGLA